MNRTCRGFGPTGCPNLACRGPYCRKHGRYAKTAGLAGMVDAAEARAHVLKLRNLGWTDVAIAERAGIAASGVWYLRHDRAVIHIEHSKAIQAIPLTPMATRIGVDAIGTRRRIASLNWMGHSRATIAAALGEHGRSLHSIMYRRRVSCAVANAVKAYYEQWADKPGTSAYSTAAAKANGAVPPAAWDEDSIDDPNAVPNLGGEDSEVDEVLVRRVVAGEFAERAAARAVLSPQDRDEAIRRMLRRGIGASTIARRIGSGSETVQKWILRIRSEEAA